MQSSLMWQTDSTERQKFAMSAVEWKDEMHAVLPVPVYLPIRQDRQPSTQMTACFSAHIY